VIEWHFDLIAPWWIIPLYIGCLGLMICAIFGVGYLIDKWWKR